MKSVFCAHQTAGRTCTRIAQFRCAECGKNLCRLHARQQKAVSGKGWLCAACHGKKTPYKSSTRY